MEAYIIYGVLTNINGDKFTIEREGYEDTILPAVLPDEEVNDDWALRHVGSSVRCTVIEGKIRKIV